MGQSPTDHAVLRGRRRRALKLAGVAAGCAAATALAACGSSGSTTTSNTVSTPHTSDVAAKFEPFLQREYVQADAYMGLIQGPAPSFTLEKQGISQLRDTLYSANLEVRKMNTPTAARVAENAYLSASNKAIAALDKLYQEPTFAAMGKMFHSLVTPSMTKYFDAKAAFRKSLGVPDFPWLQAKPKNQLVYSDSLSAPNGKIKWLLAANVRYGGGVLTVGAKAGGSGVTGPNTPYTFDGRHVAVEVDAKVASGDPYYGVQCPPAAGSVTQSLSAELFGGKWMIGIYRQFGSSSILTGPTASSAIKAGQWNHLRLDCDQFAPGLATARLYVNGKLVGSADAPLDIKKQYEAGVNVVSTGAAASAQFKNWSVSTLPTA